MEKEKWTNDVLNSFVGMKQAGPSPYLFAKIKARLRFHPAEQIPIRWAYATGASLSLLLMINISLFRNSEPNQRKEIIGKQQAINSDQIY
jgi:hypothetical protein